MERAGTGSSVEVRLLGPIELAVDGRPVAVGGPRQQALLALLAIRPGSVVPADELADELWPDSAPEGASTLRSYVSRLRRALGAAGAVHGSGRGYAIDLEPDAVDAVRFERLVRASDAALARGVAGRARDGFASALALWRGRPFGELGLDGSLRVEAERLEELRLHALERRLEADLALGHAAELVDELEGLVRRHPFRERLWHHLMLALYRAGRQADALAAYHRARAELDEQLGIEPGAELRALEAAILRQDVPAPAARTGQFLLPTPLSTFVGRHAELEDVARRLRDHRLVTLTGVGGVGKTRLALEAARAIGPELTDGAAFVDLSPLVEGDLVVAAVAAALDVREHGDASLLDRVSGALRGAELLLVLDNCEHLREAAATTVTRLLAAAPRLRVLATGRETLGVPGEAELPVAPLRLEASGGPPGTPAEAVALFMARAREARPGLTSDPRLLETAARICADLEGLPLAIELAAARARSLTLDDIAERLDDRFRFLVSWRRVTTARHRTLREAMDWSFELLRPEEQALFAGLSTFAGGFELPAVAAVCLDGDEDRAVDLLERLVEASLVIADDAAGGMRYRLLETVRQYAAQRLEPAAAERLRRAHATWYLDVAEAAAPELSGGLQATWFARLEAEHNNLRAALTCLQDAGAPGEGLRLAIALFRFWYVRGHLREGRAWLEQALEGDRDRDPILRRRALTAAASLALLQGEYGVATALAEQSLDVARSTGESRFVANALSNLGAIVLAGGDVDRAGPLLEEAVAVARGAGDERIMALAINNLGDLLLTRGEYESARPRFEESLALLRARGDTANVARALFNLGAVELELGRLATAGSHFHEGIGLAREAGDREDLAWLLEGLAALAAVRGQGERAGQLLGAAGALLAAMGADHKPFERALREKTERRARALLGDAGLAEVTARGAQLPLGDAVELALAEA